MWWVAAFWHAEQKYIHNKDLTNQFPLIKTLFHKFEAVWPKVGMLEQFYTPMKII
jgi:hypothetical protein